MIDSEAIHSNADSNASFSLWYTWMDSEVICEKTDVSNGMV